ncbi:hypothetical protein N7468_006686 [Penicillium chermesinum]|uniref:Uncharacterized protein n=1 Tax=Penicillium chermesinum TaxID=63820 RepID=A0A9W9NTE5_9EURO|nr:uncharacterized protein N7468_006686 [Penicillium chermesinum]KAJ5225461.1 hypothetical protein N7468_006686 [Penicillium chermesinum]KAJ6161313.1 hypothetical protein N7470_004709 [Penicillium chermesinum]
MDSSSESSSSVSDFEDKADSYKCSVHNLTAKVFLNRPLQDLIPGRYLRRAEHTGVAQRKAWIFRGGAEDGRQVNQKEWSKIDIRYRGVFKTLSKVPQFKKGLWEGGSEKCHGELNDKSRLAQAQLVYALLSDVTEMLDLQRPTKDGNSIFYLRPRLLDSFLEYWTGYREKHKDGPKTAGFLAMDFEPDNGGCVPILPVSSTTKEAPLTEVLDDKFKLILGQLLLHIRPLPLPGDRLPDQEIFLLGIHGSKLHLLRAYFPGQKISSLWCRRYIPAQETFTLIPRPLRHRSSSSPNPRIKHMDDSDSQHYDADHGHNIPDKSRTTSRTASYTSFPSYIQHHQQSSTETLSEDIGEMFDINLMEPLDPNLQSSHSRPRAHSHTPRFYTKNNLERIRQQLDATKMEFLDNEPDTRTFRILGTREYDLWKRKDFYTAVQMLVALQMYLFSGKALCGALQETFEKHPIRRGEKDDDSNENSDFESDSSVDEMTDQQRTLVLERHAAIEEARVIRSERELQRVEELQRREELAEIQAREDMRWGGSRSDWEFGGSEKALVGFHVEGWRWAPRGFS